MCIVQISELFLFLIVYIFFAKTSLNLFNILITCPPFSPMSLFYMVSEWEMSSCLVTYVSHSFIHEDELSTMLLLLLTLSSWGSVVTDNAVGK